MIVTTRIRCCVGPKLMNPNLISRCALLNPLHSCLLMAPILRYL